MDFKKVLNEFCVKFLNITTQKLREFIINIMLVLAGVRLGYLETLSFYHPYTFNEIKDRLIILSENKLSFNLNKGGFLITLTKNSITINDILDNNDIHLALGIILGYPSVGKKWNNGSINRYRIAITVQDDELFAFFCPVKKFTPDVKNHICDILAKSNYVLKKYNYVTTATYQLWPANESGTYYWIKI